MDNCFRVSFPMGCELLLCFLVLLKTFKCFSNSCPHYRVTYRSPVNKQVVSRLVREVKGLNPEFKTDYIEGEVIVYLTISY